jgi:hypothetical protein
MFLRPGKRQKSKKYLIGLFFMSEFEQKSGSPGFPACRAAA